MSSHVFLLSQASPGALSAETLRRVSRDRVSWAVVIDHALVGIVATPQTRPLENRWRRYYAYSAIAQSHQPVSSHLYADRSHHLCRRAAASKGSTVAADPPVLGQWEAGAGAPPRSALH